VSDSMTVKWQRAGNRRLEEPSVALLARDAEVTVKDCHFVALGNNTRCPSAVLAVGTSTVNLEESYFYAFDFTVQFAGGVEGSVKKCVFVESGHCGVTVSSDSTVTVRDSLVTGSAYHGLRCTGSELTVENCLLVENRNRGIYLGNRTARGRVVNNIIMNNSVGISGYSHSKVEIANNLILGSTHAGLAFEGTCRLKVENNIFKDNARGLCLSDKDGNMKSSFDRNNFWANETDCEYMDLPAESLKLDPRFKNPEAGEFLLGEAGLKSSPQGLIYPANLTALWDIWLKIKDPDQP
ncbi:MAG: right-handed parallel beta-helix repeat-containing protein, partial [Verrucomicrobiota bacterium]